MPTVVKPEIKPQIKPIIENKPPVSKIVEIKSSSQKPKKALDDAPPIKPVMKIQQQPKKQIVKQIKNDNKEKKIETNQVQNIFYKKRQSQPALRVSQPQKDQKPKIFFGNKLPENKADFMSALEGKIKQPEKKSVDVDRKQFVKKNPISFQIPWKGEPQKDIQKMIQQKPKSQLDIPCENQGKIIIHNKNLLIADPIQPSKNIEIVHRVKLQKKISPKVYQPLKQNQKPLAIIKSGGFSQGERAESGLRKKSQSNSNYQSSERKVSQNRERYENKSQQQQKVEGNGIYSVKNIRKQSQDRSSNIPAPKKQPLENAIYHYPPKAKKVPNNLDHKARPPKHLPHQGKTSSVSRFTQVTKEEEDLVANLPDIMKKQTSSESENEEHMKSSNPKFHFNEIDDQKVLKMYEQMLSSKSDKLSKTQKAKTTEYTEQQTQNREQYTQQQNLQQKIQTNQQYQNQDEVPQQYSMGAQNNSQIYYQVNKFGMEEDQINQVGQNPINSIKKQNQWQFDEQPQLPMLQETQTPLFEEANPYLVQQAEDEQKTMEEIIEDKKHHLQIKLKQNIKREDQINRLMQLKIQQCKAAVPKNFDEILTFFRSKINMDRQYTEQDEKQVETFLARRNLTDQRKFQNIYKIMHFQMELENTRRIIQSICKKLNQLQIQNK